MTQIFKDNETVIVARGSKALPKDSQVTILGYDATADTYAVKTDAGSIKTAKAVTLAAVPERTLTESEIRAALNSVAMETDVEQVGGALDAVYDRLGLSGNVPRSA